MTRQLDPSDEELLQQAALSSSFTRLPPRAPESKATSEPASPSTAPSVQPGPPQQATASTSTASESVEDSFKNEYDRRLAAWRAEAEVARAKAERTRAEWEVRRKAEEEEEERQRATAEESRRKEQRESTLTSWETVSPADDSKPVLGASVGGAGMSNERVPTQRASVQTVGADAQMPGVADGHPPTGGVSSKKPPAARAEQVTPPGLDSEIYTSEEDERRSSRHWEEVPSLASSFPSLPDNILSSPSSQNDKVSPKTAAKSTRKHGEKSGKHHDEHEHHNRSHSHHHHHDHGDTTVASSRGPPPSVTLSIFRPGLSPRARAQAIASSIAINFVLPFINGVMLGFGEIFAKNFVAPLFGIKPPSVANVGVRTPTTRDRRR